MSQNPESFGAISSGDRLLKPGSKWRIVQNRFRRKSKHDEVIGTWQSIAKKTYNFFGVPASNVDDEHLKEKWNSRMKQLYGRGRWLAVKDEDTLDGDFHPLDQLDSVRRRTPKPAITKKDNVLRIAFDAFKGKAIGTPDVKHRSFTSSALESHRRANPRGPRELKDITFFDRQTATSPAEEGEGGGPIRPLAVRMGAPKRKKATEGMDETDSAPLIKDKVDGKVIDDLLSTGQSKREVGTGGFFGKHFLGLTRDRTKIDPQTQMQLEAADDLLHRPFFTYWVTFVHVVCYIVTVSVYGLAPIGFQETIVEGEVLSSGLYAESVSYREKDNFWIGPRQADLIHLGAKYSPCMRKDSNVERAIADDRARENETACCIRNDGAGCVQTSRKRCSSIMSTWYKNDHGTVCAQDPNYCLEPASLEPYNWPKDIIDWPICKKTANFSNGGPAHMTCNLAGKPCCIGIQGECIVTTREHCQFLRGYFHEEAFLCSQVSCMSETCGMIPFWNPKRPDQIYRLWISLFIHAGLLQLIISILFHFLVMRDVEKMMGWFRTSLIYILSGVVGSLASAIFVPYHVEAGPSGSQFGILSCIFVELIHNWKHLSKPYTALAILLLILLTLFVVGLLPIIDNYAHLFGFVYGFLLSFSVMPHVSLNISERRKKMAAVFVCFFGSIAILLVLVLLFYVVPIYECSFCQYFSCIPFTNNFCDTMEVKIRRTEGN